MYHNLKTLYLKYPDLDISALTLTEFYRLIEKEKRRDKKKGGTRKNNIFPAPIKS